MYSSLATTNKQEKFSEDTVSEEENFEEELEEEGIFEDLEDELEEVTDTEELEETFQKTSALENRLAIEERNFVPYKATFPEKKVNLLTDLVCFAGGFYCGYAGRSFSAEGGMDVHIALLQLRGYGGVCTKVGSFLEEQFLASIEGERSKVQMKEKQILSMFFEQISSLIPIRPSKTPFRGIAEVAVAAGKGYMQGVGEGAFALGVGNILGTFAAYLLK